MKSTNLNAGQDIFETVTQSSKQPYKDYVDAFQFYYKLKELFDDLNLEDFDGGTFSKIELLEEYPDKEYTEEDVVIYSLGERYFFKNSGERSFGNFKQTKPLQLEERYDNISNNLIADYGYKFTTEVKLEVYSTSLRKCQLMTKLIESVILKHKGRLKLYVEDIIYIGQTPTINNQDYSERRLFSRGIVLQVITCETYSLVSEEIKYINFN